MVLLLTAMLFLLKSHHQVTPDFRKTLMLMAFNIVLNFILYDKENPMTSPKQ